MRSLAADSAHAALPTDPASTAIHVPHFRRVYVHSTHVPKTDRAATLGLFIGRGADTRMVFAKPLNQIPGGTLTPGLIPKYVTPLLIPPVMPKAAALNQKGGKNVDYYEISMRQFSQQILPAGLP